MFRPIKVRQYISLMEARGYSAHAVLLGSGLDEPQLSAPDSLVNMAQVQTVVSNMIRLTGNTAIGLEMGSQTGMADLGLVGYLTMSATTAREAVQHWISFCNALVGMPTRMRLEEQSPSEWSLVLEEPLSLGQISRVCVEEQLVMCLLGRDITGIAPVLRKIELSYPAPPHGYLYQRYFDAPIIFGAQQTRISFSAPHLDQPLRGRDPSFNDLCERQCELLMQQIGRNTAFAARVRSLLLRAGGGIPSIGTISRELHLSTRTIRRHLQDEGASYLQLVSDVRAELARDYLRDTAMTPKEIAYALGFRNANSFYRAFKVWTGRTAEEYRNEVSRLRH